MLYLCHVKVDVEYNDPHEIQALLIYVSKIFLRTLNLFSLSNQSQRLNLNKY